MGSRGLKTGGLLALAGIASWLLVAAPAAVLGVDSGQAGVALVATVAWISLYAVSRLPARALQDAASPAEWKAWVGTGFMAVAIAYFLAHIGVFAAAGSAMDRGAQAVARNLVLLLVAWSVLARLLSSRWKEEVQEDERDRGIAARASAWGRGALVVAVAMLAVTLGLSPESRLQWASHLLVGNLMVLAIMWGCLIEYAAAALLHWQARRIPGAHLA
jgi:Na+-transporting methylmalonyl-CoA/oxaloacetate decarboxylase gamma subunit